MPLLADKTITVRNLHYDPETDAEEEISTTLVGVSVHARTVANASVDGLNAASIFQIRIFAGHAIERAHHPLDDVVYIGEVAPHAAVVEDVDRTALEHRPRKQKQRHVGPPPRAIHGEKAQAGRRQAVQMAVRVRHQLVGLLGRRVHAHRVIDAVVL